MKASLGDRALFWGTIVSFAITGVGFTAWLTHVDYVAMNTAQAQEKEHNETSSKLENMNSKLEEAISRLSRIEGKLDKGY